MAPSSASGPKKLLLALGSLVVGVGLLELLLHLAPGLLPADFRGSYPAQGVEFFEPGLLSRTPLDGLPVPKVGAAWDGPPPSDLIELGLVSPEVDDDRRRFPRVVMPSDARGFPNARTLERAEVVLVGDSFVAATASLEPPGLTVRLGEELGAPVYNLGVPGIGPQREAWLVEEVAVELAPRVVLWFFFGGNDLANAKELEATRAAGVVHLSDREGYRPPPTLRLPALVRHLVGGGAEASPEPADFLEPFHLRGGDRPRTWLLPEYYLTTLLDRGQWERHPGWEATRASLRRARDAAAGAGATLAVVWVPSKTALYLPWLEPDLERFGALARRHRPPFEGDPEAVLARALEHRRALEGLVADFCGAEGMPFFSAHDALEAPLREGEDPYLAADTHWHVGAQEALLGPLVDFLRGL